MLFRSSPISNSRIFLDPFALRSPLPPRRDAQTNARVDAVRSLVLRLSSRCSQSDPGELSAPSCDIRVDMSTPVRHYARLDGHCSSLLGARVRLVGTFIWSAPATAELAIQRRKREEIIHSVDHFHTTVQDSGEPFKIHFVAHYSTDPSAIPLLFLHGWPVSRCPLSPLLR